MSSQNQSEGKLPSLNFIIQNPQKSQIMFSKTGRNLNIRFLNSTITQASEDRQILHVIEQKKKNKKKTLAKRTENKRFLPIRQDPPPVGHYHIKYQGIDPHSFVANIKKHKRRRIKKSNIQNSINYSLQQSITNSSLLDSTFISKNIHGSVQMKKMLNRDQAKILTRYKSNDPHQQRFNPLQSSRISSNFHQIKSPNFSKFPKRFKQKLKKQQMIHFYNPNYQFVRKSFNKSVPIMSLVSGRKQQVFQFNQSQYYDFQKNKFSSSIFSNPKTLRFQKYIKRDFQPKTPLPSFMQTQIANRLSISIMGEYGLQQNNYKQAKFMLNTSQFNKN